MHRIRVGVLRGGPSPEYEVSMKTGQSVLDSLPEDDFEVGDIFVSKDGVWNFKGLPISETAASERFDVFFNALHGKYGEDGELQGVLDSIGAKYTGSGKLGSALAMNKASAKRSFKASGLKTPAHLVIYLEGDSLKVVRDGKESSGPLEDLPKLARELFTSFPQPAVVKPLSSGSSVGVSVVYGPQEMLFAITSVLEMGEAVILEEFIKGKEATCGVVESYRGQDLYALPPVEIVPRKQSPFFDYEAKYSGESLEICPGNFTRDVKEKILEGARIAHGSLGLRHYSRSDFIVTANGSVYILETNTLPGLTSESLLPKSLQAIGSNLSEFTTHIINLARS